VTRLTVSYTRLEFDDGAASLHGAHSMLMLALRIAIAWTAVSLLCLGLWVLFLETGRIFGNAKTAKFRGKTAVGFWP
jgi:hypothetical protein